MPDIFEPFIRTFFENGFGDVIVFIFTSAIFYAIISKSKIFGESTLIAGIISLISAFLISFWIPVFTGFSFISSLSAFFTQATAILLFIIIGFLAASFFYPDMPKMLADQFTKRSTLYTMLALAIALFVTSGLVSSFWSVFPPSAPGTPVLPTDVIVVAAGLIIFVTVLLIGANIASGGIHGG